MPRKVASKAPRVSQQSIAPATSSKPDDSTTSNKVGAAQDNGLTKVGKDASGVSQTVSSIPAIQPGKEVASVKSDMKSKTTPSASRARTAAQGVIKSIKSVDIVSVVDAGTVLTQQSKSALVTNLAALSTNKPQMQQESTARSQSNPSSRRRGSHSSRWAVNTQVTLPAPIVNTNTEDQVYAYGLYLLRPEIITLFDSDPLYVDGKETSAHEFLGIQRATSKSMQESAYRRTRSLLSSLSYLPSLGFEESDLRPLVPFSEDEKQGTSLFEQAVSKWDADYSATLEFDRQAAEKASVSQNIVSALDIVNAPYIMSSETPSFLSRAAIVEKAQQYVSSELRTAALLSDAGSESEMHDYLRDVGSGTNTLTQLLNVPNGERIEESFRSYTFMHALLQQTFLNFAFGSLRDRSTLLTINRSRDTGPQSTYKYSLSSGPAGKIAEKRSFASVESYANDAVETSTELTPESAAKIMLLRITGLAAYSASPLYDKTKTAFDVFYQKLGLPVGVTSRTQGTGNAISDFETAPDQTSCNLLFQIPSVEDDRLKLMFFDRSHNPGLPRGYSHGYTRLFGSPATTRDTATDLIRRMTAALSKHEEIDRKILANEVVTRGRARKVADLSRLVLQRFSNLLESRWEDMSSPPDYTEYETSGFSDEYSRYLDIAGTGSSAASSRRLKAQFNDRSRARLIADDPDEAERLPVFVDVEYLSFMSLNVPFHGTMIDWAKHAVGLMMAYWSQRFDYETGSRDSTPDSISSQIFDFRPRSGVGNYTRELKNFYGESSNLAKLDVYAERFLDRIVRWSLNTARSLFTVADGADGVLNLNPEFASLIEHADGSSTYTLKEVCLLLTSFASFHMRSLFDRTVYRGASPENPYARFVSNAGQIVSELVSYAPISYDDARICLSLIGAQCRAAAVGLIRMTDAGGSPADLLLDGKFNPAFTPAQSAGITIRKFEFLSRRKKAPFHSPRYDVTSSVRSIERSAIRSLYRTKLMQQDDTRVIFVGLPAGMQHVLGVEQRYARVSITRRDQTDAARTFQPLTFFFDMFAHISPDTSSEIGNVPWSVPSSGDITAVKDVNFFSLVGAGDDGLGNLKSLICRQIAASHVTSPVFATEEAIRQVLVSDLIVDVEFVNINVAASELGVRPPSVTSHPSLVGNHLIDYLLKAHVRSVSGLDLSESTFTTSNTAFDVTPTNGLDEARTYFFNICALDFLSTDAVGSAKFEADVRQLDLLSRTPLIRSSNYRDLCTKPTYFDRVFAIPVNLRQFS